MSFPGMAPRALDGVPVMDATQMLAGPLALLGMDDGTIEFCRHTAAGKEPLASELADAPSGFASIELRVPWVHGPALHEVLRVGVVA